MAENTQTNTEPNETEEAWNDVILIEKILKEEDKQKEQQNIECENDKV